MSSLFTELSRLTTALNENGIEYAVCGGLALTILGYPRATFDIDILIREESLEKSFELAKVQGFDIHGLDISFKDRAVEIRRVSKIDDENGVLPLDFLLVTPAIEDVWTTRKEFDWQGNNLGIVSREGLIKMKQLAGRPKDLIDIDRMENEEN